MIKKKISLVLIIGGGGYKLPPLVIMKGKKNRYLEKNLTKLNLLLKIKFLLNAKKILGVIAKFV